MSVINTPEKLNNAARPAIPARSQYDEIPSALRAPLPKMFDGKTNVKHWITRLESYFKVQNVQDETQQIHFAVSLLEGSALDWWLYIEAQVLEKIQDPISTFGAFTDALEEYFIPFSDTATAERELALIRQTGSVMSYITKFANITIRIPGMTDGERRRCFVRGLKHNIQQEVYRHGPTTFDEVRRIAQVFDSAGIIPQSQKWFGTPRVKQRIEQYDPMDVDSLEYVQKPSQNHNKNTKKQAKPKVCFNCGQGGHYAKFCIQNKKRGF